MEELHSPWQQGLSGCQGCQDFKLLAPVETPKPIWATCTSAPSPWWFYTAGQMTSITTTLSLPIQKEKKWRK